MIKFKVGDKVRCVNPGRNNAKEGDVLTVKHVFCDQPGDMAKGGFYRFEERNDGMWGFRFELVERKKETMDTYDALKQAVEHGKKVRRLCWTEADGYIFFEDGQFKRSTGGTLGHPTLAWNDWTIYEEPEEKWEHAVPNTEIAHLRKGRTLRIKDTRTMYKYDGAYYYVKKEGWQGWCKCLPTIDTIMKNKWERLVK